MMEKTYDKTEDIFITIHLSKGGESIIEAEIREKEKRCYLSSKKAGKGNE